jgi:lipopolysaccharide/colanic/teichoic acid biosynthesis glycosyltransferase
LTDSARPSLLSAASLGETRTDGLGASELWIRRGDAGALQKLQYEFYYLQNQSLWLDLRIIARTVRSVVGGSGQ